ncbi:MAG: hypothetical protein PUD34_01580 [bacterium]|nr:hypothetical protein [bacterium]
MEFDLNKITDQGIIIDTRISFGEEYLKISQIKKLDDVKVNGRIYYSLSKEVIFSGKVSGEMILEDGYTLEEVPYPFEVQIEQVLADYSSEEAEKKCKRTKNILDLKEVLWENIVLEVPIVAKSNKDVLIKSGNGWEVRDEISKKDDPRLECFRALLDEGKE